MIKFKQFLKEIFDQPYQFKNVTMSQYRDDRHDYEFTSPHDRYKVSLYHGMGGKMTMQK